MPCQNSNNSELPEPQNIPENNQETVENVLSRASIDSLPNNENEMIPPQHHSSKINEISNDIEFPSFHSDFLEESGSPIIFKKPKKVLKRKIPKLDTFDLDISNDDKLVRVL